MSPPAKPGPVCPSPLIPCLQINMDITSTYSVVHLRERQKEEGEAAMCLCWPGGYKDMSSILALVNDPKCWGRGGVPGSQPMSTAVYRSPNKLWRSSNSLLNLWCWLTGEGGHQRQLKKCGPLLFLYYLNKVPGSFPILPWCKACWTLGIFVVFYPKDKA